MSCVEGSTGRRLAVADDQRGEPRDLAARIAAHPVAAVMSDYLTLGAAQRLSERFPGAECVSRTATSDAYAAAEAALTAALDADDRDRAEARASREEISELRQIIMDAVAYGRRMVDDETLTIDRDTAVERILARLDVLEG